MFDSVLDWLAREEGPATYLVLALAASIEYVIPPLPGDTVTLFGIFLAASAGYSPAIVYAVVTGGAVVGSLIPWAVGRWIGRHPDRWPAFFRQERRRRVIEGAQARYRRHGAAYLILNRFVPALRAMFFIAAGMAEISLAQVLFFGGLSAALWNGLLLGAGWLIGDNWESLQGLATGYAWFAFATLAVLALVYAVWRRLRSSD